MTSCDTYIAMYWITVVVILAVMISDVAARELSGSPMASPNATIVRSQDKVLNWLNITLVPLGVSLIGLCIWGCIKKSEIWRSLTCEHRSASIAPEANEMRSAHELPNNSSHDGSDLEEGIALSERGVDEGPAMTAETLPIPN
ncbi:hypothetical protein M758_4G091600 [Ceratodon purpureus]|nr:hypothetical protein M758_4G091600 [Ceratodon purpureus]